MDQKNGSKPPSAHTLHRAHDDPETPDKLDRPVRA